MKKESARLQFGSEAIQHGTTSSYWPRLFDTSIPFLLGLLSFHIAIPTQIDFQTANDVLDYILNSALIFYQTPGAMSITDPAFYRWGTAVHSIPGTMYSGRPFSHKSHQDYHDRFLNGIILYALNIGMPEALIPWLKWYPIGYESRNGLALGRHNDTPNHADRWLFRIRLAICLAAKRTIEWTIVKYDGSTAKPILFRDEEGKPAPKITLGTEGCTVYAMSSSGCGCHPLGIVGDSDTLLIAEHEVRTFGGGKALSIIIDIPFDSKKAEMAAMNQIKTETFSLDFTGNFYTMKHFYGQDTMLKVGNIACHIVILYLTVPLTLTDHLSILNLLHQGSLLSEAAFFSISCNVFFSKEAFYSISRNVFFHEACSCKGALLPI